MTHIVCVDISPIDQNSYNQLYTLASAERKKRADRYLRTEDKIRCVVSDALLRYAVREALSTADFSVERSPGGKPRIKNAPDLHYNLSHSGRWVVIAWGGNPVGIDVEQIRMDAEKENIARRFFTQEEQDYIFCSDESCQADRFFQIWTAKESYLKYLGTGLRRPLDSFCVVPDGSHLGVRMSSTFLEDHCVTVCTRDEHTIITHLSVQQLI